MDGDTYIITFEATVATGFEAVLCAEIKSKISSCSSLQTEKGRVIFSCPLENCVQIFSLKGADHLNLLLAKSKDISFANDREADLEQLRHLSEGIDWNCSLKAWLKVTSKENPHVQQAQSFAQENYSFSSFPNSDLHNVLSLLSIDESPEKDFRFRVTCYRSGGSHSFSSQEAARAFGGAIKDKYHWKVDLKNHDLEVILYINGSSYYTCLSLTRTSLHFRNLTVCGRLTLRPTVAHNILRLASIQHGDIVCDPMAGFGTIPIEAAMEFPVSHVLCGDVNALAVEQCAINVTSLNKKLDSVGRKALNLSVCRWDAFCLPLRNNSVDAIVTDLPFGKTCGRRSALPFIYENVTKEMTRICRAKTGRCVMLVLNQKLLSQIMGRLKEFWFVNKIIPINLGNLKAKVCVFKRTDKSV